MAADAGDCRGPTRHNIRRAIETMLGGGEASVTAGAGLGRS